jgi:hypothetical protein
MVASKLSKFVEKYAAVLLGVKNTLAIINKNSKATSHLESESLNCSRLN